MSRYGLLGVLCTTLLLSPLVAQEKVPDKANAYYHYSLGHLYAELASAYGNRGEYLNQAIDHLRLAMKADPSARFLSEELSDLYIQGGRLKEGVLDAEDTLRQNPNDVNARRVLGRIYMRLIGDTQQGRINEDMCVHLRADPDAGESAQIVPGGKFRQRREQTFRPHERVLLRRGRRRTKRRMRPGKRRQPVAGTIDQHGLDCRGSDIDADQCRRHPPAPKCP